MNSNRALNEKLDLCACIDLAHRKVQKTGILTFLTASRRRRPGIIKLAAIAGLALLVCGLVAMYLLSPSTKANASSSLNAGLRLLRRGQAEEARMAALAVPLSHLSDTADLSKHALLLGAGALEESERASTQNLRYKRATEALEYLEKSKSIEFPRGHEGLGYYLLGKTLYELNRWNEAIEPLKLGLGQWPGGRSEALSRLIDIAASESEPDWEKISDQLDYWESLVGITPSQLEEAKLKRIEMALQAGKIDEVREMVEQFPKESSLAFRALYYDALSYLPRGFLGVRSTSWDSNRSKGNSKDAITDPRSDLNLAISKLSPLLGLADTSDRTRRRIEFYLGKSLQAEGRYLESISTLSSLRQRAPYTIEGLTATVEELRSLIELGRPDEAVKLLDSFREQLGDPAWYENKWVGPEQWRSELMTLAQVLLQNEQYAQLVQFVRGWPPYFREEDRLRFLAEGYRGWAETLFRESSTDQERLAFDFELPSIPSVDVLRKFKEAAGYYEKLAREEIRSPEYDRLVKTAIDCYQAAGELTKANQLIQQQLQLADVEFQPWARLKLAENYFTLQQPNRALLELQTCINQHPRHLLSYPARLNAAIIKLEQGEYEEASKLLEENLYGGDLTPASPVWKESLFRLGRLYFQRGEQQLAEAKDLAGQVDFETRNKRFEIFEAANRDFLTSIDRLEEWLKRYPNDSRKLDTLYSVAQAYRLAAQWIDLQLQENLLPSDDLRRTRFADRQELLDSAKGTFQMLRSAINSSPDVRLSDSKIQRLLRNSYFGEADLLYQAKEFEQALIAYRAIANRFLNEPESLEALVQVAECLKRLGRNEEGVRVLNQARDLLNQIPASKDQQFVSVTRHSRADWANLLDWMKQNTF